MRNSDRLAMVMERGQPQPQIIIKKRYPKEEYPRRRSERLKRKKSRFEDIIPGHGKYKPKKEPCLPCGSEEATKCFPRSSCTEDQEESTGCFPRPPCATKLKKMLCPDDEYKTPAAQPQQPNSCFSSAPLARRTGPTDAEEKGGLPPVMYQVTTAPKGPKSPRYNRPIHFSGRNRSKTCADELCLSRDMHVCQSVTSLLGETSPCRSSSRYSLYTSSSSDPKSNYLRFRDQEKWRNKCRECGGGLRRSKRRRSQSKPKNQRSKGSKRHRYKMPKYCNDASVRAVYSTNPEPSNPEPIANICGSDVDLYKIPGKSPETCDGTGVCNKVSTLRTRDFYANNPQNRKLGRVGKIKGTHVCHENGTVSVLHPKSRNKLDLIRRFKQLMNDEQKLTKRKRGKKRKARRGRRRRR